MTDKQTPTPEFKAKVVLEVLTQAKKIADSSREYGIPEPVIEQWVNVFLERAPRIFEDEHVRSEQEITDPAFVASLERSLEENRDIWEELAKH
ncbi:MAG TPA: hypothetical protein PKD09_22025 [Aggregatilinea sp.]|uniref:hypothetical protein n=1 Tax=Aggregatilinea sp. TaxID=2806333 RepID=UPI002C4B5989|nr:hypothetical protein [Aggregatilinea sp.]HML24350.1 hypothetical protein [Aggregatilinea sp.]